jgi:hypothetical protein
VLLRDQGEDVVAIGQPSHAWLAGQLARLWGNDRFAAPEPHEEVCLGAEQHDVGWSEWDLRPTLNPETGRPHSFLEVPVETHIALWSAAPERLLSQSRYSALLVSMHGTALNERRDLSRLEPRERDLVTGYLCAQRALRGELVEQLGADPAELARNQRLVWAWDSLSLALCLRWRTLTLEEVPVRAGPAELTLRHTGPDTFTLHPWPLSTDRVEVGCEGRLLTARSETEADLHESLARAPVIRITVTLSAA